VIERFEKRRLRRVPPFGARMVSSVVRRDMDHNALIRGEDGGHIQVRETIGEGGSIRNQEVLEKRPQGAPLIPAQEAAAAARPPDAGTFTVRLAPPDSMTGKVFSNGTVTFKVPPQVQTVSTRRPSLSLKVPIDGELSDLQELERQARYFPGLTEAQFESARTVASTYLIYLPSTLRKRIPEPPTG